MKILITGGSGFIGNHLINNLISTIKNCEIVNLDLNKPTNNLPQVTTYIIDIRKPEMYNKIKLSNFDLCIHLAALCKEPGYAWDEYFNTNHIGTQNVLELCDKLETKKILFTSTMMVYKAGEERRVESSIKSPDTAYGISKLLAEKEIENWAIKDINKQYGILRPSVVFGKNENGNFTKLHYALKSNTFVYVGRRTTVKSCVYVKDVCNALCYFIEKDIKDTFNFAFIKDYQISEIVKSFKKVFKMNTYTPVVPLSVLMIISRVFLMLNNVGVKNSIHPRRIEKLYYSTNINSSKIIDLGFNFEYNLDSALKDWKKECGTEQLF